MTVVIQLPVVLPFAPSYQLFALSDSRLVNNQNHYKAELEVLWLCGAFLATTCGLFESTSFLIYRRWGAGGADGVTT
jgi:hypothetical protein